MKPSETDIKNFWKKVKKTPGCWLWTASLVSKNGYGKFHFKLTGKTYRNISAHRASYTINTGPIPDKLFVLHRCDVKHCVRPDHLFLGTQQDNVRDCVSKGRWNPGRYHAFKTHCPQGHPYSITNTHNVNRKIKGVETGKTNRRCRTCAKLRARIYVSKNRTEINERNRKRWAENRELLCKKQQEYRKLRSES